MTTLSPTSVLPHCWAIVNLMMARYGQLATSHVAGQLALAEERGDAEIASLWRSVLSQLRRQG
ncbi:MAG: hypothetical protein EB121_04640 [Alphaproteobacteria bacterium]|nr:hypothetical protein [Alphaproteobacteria bacterium]NDG04620.1 hypothetical protein [Alphaproteobacteria bacterium]